MTSRGELSVSVIGNGYWGKNLVRNFHQLGYLHSICDVSAVGLEQARFVDRDVQLFSDFDQVLESGVRGIVVATPAETHFSLVARALEAGKDVFVEKPLALTYDQGNELVALAQRRQLILMVGHVLEYHPAVNRLIQMISNGELGKVRYIYSNRLSLGKVRREENILWSFAPHDIAVILRLLGQMPFQVVACGGSYIQPNIADVTVTSLLFDNGVRSHIHVSWLHPFKEQRLVVIGSRKMASFDDVSKKLVLYDQHVDIREGEPLPFRGEGEEIAFSSSEPLRLECQAFIKAITERRQPLTDGESGLRVLKVLQAAQRSLVMNGEPVTLPLENPTMPLVGNGSQFPTGDTP